MTRVKICGITRKQDTHFPLECGVDALGFIFYPESPRYVDFDKAKEIIAPLPPFVDKVGVFVNSPVEEILKAIYEVGITTIQLHGDEPPAFCTKLKTLTKLKIIKALRVKDPTAVDLVKTYTGTVDAALLDTYKKGEYGGTGEVFNWELAIESKKAGLPIILAGGLTPNNVVKAILCVKPYAVDINSGVEDSPGFKSNGKIKLLFDNLNANIL